MNNQSYQGYPPWRLDKFKEHSKIIKTLFTDKIDEFENGSSVSKLSKMVIKSFFL